METNIFFFLELTTKSLLHAHEGCLFPLAHTVELWAASRIARSCLTPGQNVISPGSVLVICESFCYRQDPCSFLESPARLQAPCSLLLPFLRWLSPAPCAAASFLLAWQSEAACLSALLLQPFKLSVTCNTHAVNSKQMLGAGPSCLDRAFAKKGWTRWSLRSLPIWYSMILWISLLVYCTIWCLFSKRNKACKNLYKISFILILLHKVCAIWRLSLWFQGFKCYYHKLFKPSKYKQLHNSQVYYRLVSSCFW